MVFESYLKNKISGLMRECVAEFLGTGILCLFGCGVCAQAGLTVG